MSEQLKALRSIRRENVKKTMKRPLNKLNYCLNCNNDTVIEDAGKEICAKCGIFHNSKIDADQEKFNYNDGKSDPTRTNIEDNYLIPSSNKGSIYGYSNNINKRGNKTHNSMLRVMNNWKVSNYKDTNMLHRFNNITSICKNAGIGNIVIDDAKEVFYKIHSVHSPRRNKLNALMGSSVIIACKKQGHTYNINKIASMFNVSLRVLRSMLNEYEHMWKDICDKEERKQIEMARASLDEDNQDGEIVIEKLYKQETIKTNSNFNHYFNMLGIDKKYIPLIEKLENYITENKILIEHVPKSITACLIYIFCDLYNIKVKKNMIAKVCGTSTITINKCYNKLLPQQDDIIKFLETA